MKIGIIAFSARGQSLAEHIAKGLEDSDDTTTVACGFGTEKVGHAAWVEREWPLDDALVFVGAAGIAVRSIAPYVQSKAADPAVVVIDERARHAVALLSGHIGGANLLAARIAHITGADPVITTATDVNELFAVDSWAVSQGLSIIDTPTIKRVSAKVIAHEKILVASEFPIEGDAPRGVGFLLEEPFVPEEGHASELSPESEHAPLPDPAIRMRSRKAGHAADVTVGVHASGTGLRCTPRALVLGIGCRRGITESALEKAFGMLCIEQDLLEDAFCLAASIDLKQDEPGLVAFCASHGIVMSCYTAQKLNKAVGTFSSSEFVKKTTGTDNVCERAVACAGAAPLVARHAKDGITMAVGILPVHLDWKTRTI